MKGVDVLGSRILLRPSEPEQSRRFYRDTLGLLAPGASEAAVVEAAQARGVGIYGISGNRSTRSPDPPQLVLGFGNLSQRAIIEGITHVAPLLQATFA